MAKPLGPSFESEVRAAGLLAIPFGWDAGGTIHNWENLTPEQRARIQAVIDAHDPAAPAPPLSPAPSTIAVTAMAELTVDGDEITGVETAIGIGFAMALEPNVFWIFFAQSEPDLAYIPFVQSAGSDVDVTDRTTDYFEATVTDRSTGEAAIPTRLMISVQRVQ